MQSSPFMSPLVIAMTKRLSYRLGHKLSVNESDFTALMFAILSFYLDPSSKTLSPESWNNNRFNKKGRCDGLVCGINLDNTSRFYGNRIPYIMYEAKTHAGTGWEKLMMEQVWEQADSTKNPKGRIWALVQRGFEVCVFKFDSAHYTHSYNFYNFKPLNLNHFDERDLIDLDAIPIIELIHNVRVIQVIRWKLNDEAHHSYIHAMLQHIFNNNL